ncbi:prolipoprotein diacylglyceryl transferase [Prauserella endophytica]|uniref:MarR family transcriptional regulator n=1 Tax=Prauserella endophytica TaxID=1592324 RepID=A0ABY2RUF7_9PSEU|nr:hypothetical protein [Prauserella endophytica]TKG60955.1 hypothetical protein FCN18_34560 [Prauserella endophytica]
MSRKNRSTRTTTAATDGDRHLHAVADAPGQQNAPTTEDKVRKALTDNPSATTAKLAMAAGVGRSTAAKILARWDREGTAIRTAGDGPRNPDTWALATPDQDAPAPDTEDAQPDVTGTPSVEPTDHASDIADATTEDPGATEEADTDIDGSTTEDITAAQEATIGSEVDDHSESDAPATDTSDDKAAPSSDGDADNDGTTPLPDAAPAGPVDSGTESEPPSAEPSTGAVSASTDKDRLPKGGLRALVEEYLTNHPGESFGPAKIGKDLSRSGGAVNNALEKLVADGYAIKTCEAPKRFQINPDKTDVPATAEDADEPALEA